jgi:hypothetical protein
VLPGDRFANGCEPKTGTPAGVRFAKPGTAAESPLVSGAIAASVLKFAGVSAAPTRLIRKRHAGANQRLTAQRLAFTPLGFANPSPGNVRSDFANSAPALRPIRFANLSPAPHPAAVANPWPVAFARFAHSTPAPDGQRRARDRGPSEMSQTRVPPQENARTTSHHPRTTMNRMFPRGITEAVASAQQYLHSRFPFRSILSSCR